MISYEKQLERLKNILLDCKQKKFWGKVTLQLAEGNLVEVQVTQTLRLKEEEEVLCVKQRDKCESH